MACRKEMVTYPDGSVSSVSWSGAIVFLPNQTKQKLTLRHQNMKVQHRTYKISPDEHSVSVCVGLSSYTRTSNVAGRWLAPTKVTSPAEGMRGVLIAHRCFDVGSGFVHWLFCDTSLLSWSGHLARPSRSFMHPLIYVNLRGAIVDCWVMSDETQQIIVIIIEQYNINALVKLVTLLG
jgi:hypothetical protein